MSMLIYLIMTAAATNPHAPKKPGPPRESFAVVASGPVSISPLRRASQTNNDTFDQYIYYSQPLDYVGCGYFGGSHFNYLNNYSWSSHRGWGSGVLGDPTH